MTGLTDGNKMHTSIMKKKGNFLRYLAIDRLFKTGHLGDSELWRLRLILFKCEQNRILWRRRHALY